MWTERCVQIVRKGWRADRSTKQLAMATTSWFWELKSLIYIGCIHIVNRTGTFSILGSISSAGQILARSATTYIMPKPPVSSYDKTAFRPMPAGHYTTAYARTAYRKHKRSHRLQQASHRRYSSRTKIHIPSVPSTGQTLARHLYSTREKEEGSFQKISPVATIHIGPVERSSLPCTLGVFIIDTSHRRERSTVRAVHFARGFKVVSPGSSYPVARTSACATRY